MLPPGREEQKSSGGPLPGCSSKKPPLLFFSSSFGKEFSVAVVKLESQDKHGGPCVYFQRLRGAEAEAGRLIV